MPFDGSGNFNRVMNWVNDASASIKIKADRHDQEDDNLAQGLSNTLTKDGQSQPTANIPMNGKRIVNMAAPVNPTDAVTKGYVDADFVHGLPDKAVPVDADEMLLSNSASTPAWQRAKVTFANLKTAITGTFGTFIHALTAKPVLVDADELLIADSVSTPTAWASKKLSWLNLQTMIGIATGQRLNKFGAPLTDLNTATESGWYNCGGTAANAPAPNTGLIHVVAITTDAVMQFFYAPGLPTFPEYMRYKWSGAWSAWVTTTSKNALLKDVDGVVVDAGYTQTPRVTPDAPAAGVYTPSPVGGNTRQVNSVGTAWSFAAPTFTGNYTMVVLINNPAISGAVTFTGFNRVTFNGGTAHPTALGKMSIVYITKVGAAKTAFVEVLP